jgi:hypothetical protein
MCMYLCVYVYGFISSHEIRGHSMFLCVCACIYVCMYMAKAVSMYRQTFLSLVQTDTSLTDPSSYAATHIHAYIHIIFKF